MVSQVQLFAQVVELPDPQAQERFAALVGIDDVKDRLVTEAAVLLDPGIVDRWSSKHYKHVTRAAKEVSQRTPLVVLAGDVGTGKTEVAETFGDAVARTMKVGITLYPLSLSARGKGAVGEMTTLLSDAFAQVHASASSARDSNGKVTRGVILLIDEADALAQSRELAQMHHEDRAGVNALVRGIDELRDNRLPVLTVMCTNRLDALDPAVIRRAAAVLPFTRPNDEQRHQLLESLLDGLSINGAEVDKLVALTGANADRPYGCTYSDIRQRLIPDAVLASVREDVKLNGGQLIARAEMFQPTQPFGNR
ncbi:MAG TPA: AAA family ATPase [Acidimicrobiales bacterium]|nr:AAA family ATPase [Acidimicrobiales bacterium]